MRCATSTTRARCRSGFAPAIFSAHTLSSAFVWWGASDTVSEAIGDAATTFYLFIAFVLLPIYVPVAIAMLEPPGWRRVALALLWGLGLLAGAVFLVGLVSGEGSAAACDFYFDFRIAGTPSFAGVLYVLATCGAMLLSGQRPLFWWGVANAASVAVLVVLNQNGLPSLWCFWAACTSFFVAWYLRRLRRDRQAGIPWPWQASVPTALSLPPAPGQGGGGPASDGAA